MTQKPNKKSKILVLLIALFLLLLMPYVYLMIVQSATIIDAMFLLFGTMFFLIVLLSFIGGKKVFEIFYSIGSRIADDSYCPAFDKDFCYKNFYNICIGFGVVSCIIIMTGLIVKMLL